MIDYKKNFLFIVAHPDDEVLGPGALISKIVRNGGKLTIIYCTLGFGKKLDYKKKYISNAIKILSNNKKIEYKILGFKGLMLSEKKLMLNTAIQKIVNKYKPNYVFTHHPHDINEDHYHVFNSANVATRPHKENHLVDYLFTFETPSSTEWNSFQPKNQFCPNVFIEINKKELITKIDAFKEYKSEVMKAPNPRSTLGLKNLAAYRGNIFSRQYAEAFCLIKSIIKND